MQQEASPSIHSVTERARQAAASANFGSWERSLRVNGHVDGSDITNGAILVFFAPWVFIAMGLFMPGGSWWMRAFCIAIGLIFLCVGLALFPKAWRRRRAGAAITHLFGGGAVLERTKGQIFALSYADTPVDYVSWKEPIEGGERTRQHLWITLPESRTVMLDGWGKEEQQDLASLAERWGLSPEPRPLGKEPETRPLW